MWSEFHKLRFTVYQDVEGEPNRVYLEWDDKSSTLLQQKQIPRLYMTLKKGASWDEANQLCARLSTMVSDLCIVHLAGGET
jgi:hypothetical protein